MSFEERLLVELKTHLRERAEADAGTAPPRRPRARTGRAVRTGAALLGAAAVAAVAVPLVTGTQTSAYAVTENPDGTIRVQINELRDPDRLEADLRAQGVTADITYLPEGKRCAADIAPGDRTGRVVREDGAPGTRRDDAFGDGIVGHARAGDEAAPGKEKSGDPGAEDGKSLIRSGDPGTGGGKPDKSLGESGESDKSGDRSGKVTHSNKAKPGESGPEADSFGGRDIKSAVEPKSPNIFVISPSAISPGQTVVLRFSEQKRGQAFILGWSVADGPVTPCVVVAG